MNILIVGAGKSGVNLAEKLRGDHDVTLVEVRADRVEELRTAMPDVRVIRGDGCEPAVLERAGASNADLVAALTGDDEDNLVISFLSKTTHQVPKVVARTSHPKNEWMFTKTWGVDVAISTASVIYTLIEKEVSLGDVITLMGLSADNMVIDTVTLPAQAQAVGKTLAELDIPKCAHVMAIISGGEIVVPRGDTALKAGDEVLILSSCGENRNLRRTFGVEPEAK